MTQSSFIAAALLAGFILFLAAKNRLTAYTAVLWGASAPAPTLANTGASPAKVGISSTLFGASGPTTPTMNPIQGTANAIGAVAIPLVESIFGF